MIQMLMKKTLFWKLNKMHRLVLQRACVIFSVHPIIDLNTPSSITLYRSARALVVMLPSYQLWWSIIDNTEVCAHVNYYKVCVEITSWTFLNLIFSRKLGKEAVLKALCADFRETTEPMLFAWVKVGALIPIIFPCLLHQV